MGYSDGSGDDSNHSSGHKSRESHHHHHHSHHKTGSRHDKEEEVIDEEDLKRREIEQKKRLERRIEIAEKGPQLTTASFSSSRRVWCESPTHNHDTETFNNDKGNLYGKLRYNLTEAEKSKEREEKKSSSKKKKKKDKKKKHKKKSKKSKKAKKESESESDSSSGSDTEVEALEFNIDNVKKDVNTSDEEEIDKMIIDNRLKVRLVFKSDVLYIISVNT